VSDPVSLATARKHLNIEDGYVADDAYIAGLIIAARRKVELDTRRTFSGDVPTLDGDDAALAGQAVLLIIGHWYANREAVSSDGRVGAALPMSVGWIVDSLCKWDDGL